MFSFGFPMLSMVSKQDIVMLKIRSFPLFLSFWKQHRLYLAPPTLSYWLPDWARHQ